MIGLLAGMNGVRPVEHAAGICSRGGLSPCVMPSRYIRQEHQQADDNCDAQDFLDRIATSRQKLCFFPSRNLPFSWAKESYLLVELGKAVRAQSVRQDFVPHPARPTPVSASQQQI